MIKGFGCKIWNLEFRIWDSELGFRVLGSEFGVEHGRFGKEKHAACSNHHQVVLEENLGVCGLGALNIRIRV